MCNSKQERFLCLEADFFGYLELACKFVCHLCSKSLIEVIKICYSPIFVKLIKDNFAIKTIKTVIIYNVLGCAGSKVCSFYGHYVSDSI